MNKDVEELKWIIERYDKSELGSIDVEVLKGVLDCITSLQQEKDLLEKANNKLISEFTDLEAKYYDALDENKRLKEENKHIFANVNDDELLINNAMNYAEAQDYKSRIDKAIARIKLLGKYDGKYCTRNFKMMSADFNDLLNILQGVDK